MSVLSDMQAEIGIPALMEINGGNAVHSRRNGTTQTFLASIDEQPTSSMREDSQGRYYEFMAQLIVPMTDVSGEAASIDEQGTFSVSGVNWRIVGVAKPAGALMIELRRTSHKQIKTMKPMR